MFNKIGLNVPPIPVSIFLIIILTVAAGSGVYNFVWLISGREIVEVTTQSITIHRVALGLGPSKVFSGTQIKDLRVSPSNMNFDHPILMIYDTYYFPSHHVDIGTLAFDYGAETFKFGGGVNEAEAKQILAEIQQKYPQYKN